MFKIFKNNSCLIPRPRAKIFDPANKKTVTEPDDVIDPRIDFRALSIESQIVNGTVNKSADFGNFGANPLDMSDAISASMQDFNNRLDEIDLENAKKQEFDNLIKSLDDISNV